VAQLDYADIQGTILRGYRVDHARHFVLRVADGAAARAFLGSLVDGRPGTPQITTAAPWTAKPDTFLNLGMTSAGLSALGLPPESLATFPEAFVRGATADATKVLVGDVGSSDPSQWVGGLSDETRVHVVLSLWVHGSSDVLERASVVLREAFAGALSEVSALDAAALPDNKVHFGYTDNISQPEVEGAPPTKRPRPDHQPVAPTGEFLLGHPNQYGSTYGVQPVELSTNSSFAAFRLLEQDVAGFEDFLDAYSAKAGTDRETLAAKVCGRWRNGLPLVLSPDTQTPAEPLPRERINDYDYVSDDPSLDDTFGYKCPVGSHMRRTNPRGQSVLGGSGHLHRIVRRAMPYGPPYDPARPDDEPRGLVGWFINADLGNQFEFVMSQWVNGSNFVMSVRGPGGANPVKNVSGQDVIIGVNDPSSSSFTLSTPASSTTPAANTKLTGFRPYVTTRGGAYCYLPSVTALRYLTTLGEPRSTS
jgi:deferrochelatase/peroxidase EfeB